MYIFQRIVQLSKPSVEWRPSYETHSTTSGDVTDQECPPDYKSATNGAGNYDNPSFNNGPTVDTRF